MSVNYELFELLCESAKRFIHGPTAESATHMTLLGEGMGLEVAASLIVEARFKCKSFDLSETALPIFLVVTPTFASTETISASLEQHLSARHGKQVRTRGVAEGTSSETRATYYGAGGVIVLPAKTLCADILHQRVATRLAVGLLFVFVFDRVPTSAAETEMLCFCLELIENSGAAVTRHIVCDAPWLVATPVGHELLRKLNVVEVAIYPRFRMEVVHYFEQRVTHTVQFVKQQFVSCEEENEVRRCVETIISEAMSELELKVATHCDGAAPSRKRHRATHWPGEENVGNPVEMSDSAEPWSVEDLRGIAVKDVLLGRFDSVLRRIASCSAASVRKLIDALFGLRRLHFAASQQTAAQFLITLDEATQPSQQAFSSLKSRGVGGGSSVSGPDLPVWTMSTHFPLLVSLACNRVFSIEPSQSGSAQIVPAEMPQRGKLHQTIVFVSSIVLSWAAKSNAESNEAASVVVCVKDEASLNLVIDRLMHDEAGFRDSQFLSFLDHYRSGLSASKNRCNEHVDETDLDLKEDVVDEDVPRTQVLLSSDVHAAVLNEGALPHSSPEVQCVRTPEGAQESQLRREFSISLQMRAADIGVVSFLSVSGPTQRFDVFVCCPRSVTDFFNLVDRAGMQQGGLCSKAGSVLMYDFDLRALRMLEVAAAMLPAQVNVTLLTAEGTSLDFELHEHALETERQSVRRVATERAHLTARMRCCQAAAIVAEGELEPKVASRRKALVRVDANPKIICDERELRAVLPAELFRRGISITPLTLVCADYVLSPDVAFERKSTADFCQSIVRGRLMNQLTALGRSYDFPMLLIEFERSQNFRLQYGSLDPTRGTYILYAKLVRIVTALPRLSVLWSRSPSHSAILAMRLKQTMAVQNPDVSDPSLTSTKAETEREESLLAAEVLSRFPGVTSNNINAIMSLANNLAGLAYSSLADLRAAMDETAAKKLFDALHADLSS